MVPYYGVYQLMAAGFGGWISYPVILENSILIIAAMLIRFILFGSSGVLSHKGAYGALFKVRCINHFKKTGTFISALAVPFWKGYCLAAIL